MARVPKTVGGVATGPRLAPPCTLVPLGYVMALRMHAPAVGVAVAVACAVAVPLASNAARADDHGHDVNVWPVNVWPLPMSINAGPGEAVRLDPRTFSIVAPAPASSAVLAAAITRFSGSRGLIFARPEHAHTPPPPPSLAREHARKPHVQKPLENTRLREAKASAFKLAVVVADTADATLAVGSCGHADPRVRCINESYTLSVTPSGGELRAPTVWGALHGLETFAQLVQYSAPTGCFSVAPVHVEDAPRFE